MNKFTNDVAFVGGAKITGLPQPTAEGEAVALDNTGHIPAALMPGGGSTGEVNTASNVNVGGIGIYKQKTGVNLEFRGINGGSNKVSVANDVANNEIDIDVVEGNLTLGNLGGSIDLGSAKAAGTLAAARMPALTGDVTSTAGGLATTIAAGAVSNAKQAAMAANTVKANITGSSAAPADVDLASFRSWLALTGGDVANTPSGTIAATTLQAAINELDSEKLAAAGGTIAGNLTVTGNLAVSGSTYQIDATQVTYDDIILVIGGDTAPVADDAKDRGIEFRWHNGTTAKVGFFGFDRSTQEFAFLPDATDTADVLSGADGTIRASLNGNAATASAWQTGRTITTTGDVTGTSAAFNGSTNLSFGLTIANDAVSNAKLSNVATATLKGRSTAGTGDPEDLTAAQARSLLNVADGANNYIHPNHTGDVTSVADGATTIANDAVSNVKLANMATATIKGRSTAGTGDPEDLTAAQVKTLLAIASGDVSGLGALATLNTVTSSQITDLTVATGDLADNAVTNAKLSDMATATFKGRTTAGTGDPEDLTVAQAKSLLNLAGTNSGDQTITLTGDVSGSGTASFAATIANNAVDNAKSADMPANSVKVRAAASTGDPGDLTLSASQLLGRGSTGDVAAITLGTNLSMSGATLNATGGGGGGSGDVVGPASATDNALPRFDTTTGKLIQNSDILVTDANEMDLPSVASPAAPATDRVRVYAKKFGNRMLPAFMGPSGLDSMMQPFLGFDKVGLFNPSGNSASVPGVFGLPAPTAVGTATSRVVATTRKFTRTRRLGYVSAATAGSLAAMHFASLQFTTSDGAGVGGFFLCARFGVSDAATVSGARSFYGVRNVTTAPTNVEPSTLTNVIGIGNGAADTNLRVFYGGSTAQTSIDLGANFPANTLSTDLYELVLFAPPNALRTVHYQVSRLNTGHVATGSLSGTAVQMPSETTLLQAFCAWRSNNATALAVGIDIASVYIETDT